MGLLWSLQTLSSATKLAHPHRPSQGYGNLADISATADHFTSALLSYCFAGIQAFFGSQYNH
jgi:hypothetical protein